MPSANRLGQQPVFQRVIRLAREATIPFVIGGFHGMAAYTGQDRDSKDLDLYVLPDDRERMIGVLRQAGLADYYDRLPYDRGWIYRAHENGAIVDVIWGMANYRGQVDAVWLEAGQEMEIAGERLRALPAEELLWTRLYVVQRDRCDWPDVMNLLAAAGPELDWERLLARLGEDRPLLAGALAVFSWLDPCRAALLPSGVWQRLGIAPPQAEAGLEKRPPHADLLDRRPWYLT
jgi:hypothetical protein